VNGSGLDFEKGAEMGQFNLGSTIVLVFEAPVNFEFNVEAGQKIHMGQLLGRLTDVAHTSESHPPLHSVQQIVDSIGSKDKYL
jgi:hypothetical protein